MARIPGREAQTTLRERGHASGGFSQRLHHGDGEHAQWHGAEPDTPVCKLALHQSVGSWGLVRLPDPVLRHGAMEAEQVPGGPCRHVDRALVVEAVREIRVLAHDPIKGSSRNGYSSGVGLGLQATEGTSRSLSLPRQCNEAPDCARPLPIPLA